eukprot:6825703-Prymnesium_polylepis.1
MAASARACRMPVPRVHTCYPATLHIVASVRAPCPTCSQPPCLVRMLNEPFTHRTDRPTSRPPAGVHAGLPTRVSMANDAPCGGIGRYARPAVPWLCFGGLWPMAYGAP